MVGRPQVSQQFRFMFVGEMPHFPMQWFLALLGLWRRARSIPDNDEEGRMWMFGIARKLPVTHSRGSSHRLTLADRFRDS